ncbi:dead end protein homolog 1 [Lates japonicus]|uniref:Dead end protein homolog 1 n=1 Tax=Lates japonicus TaxID=270547 RepID=A0AAD3RLN4_LATJO|nr:dead end protein homolog 1 [Lates japonicus]
MINIDVGWPDPGARCEVFISQIPRDTHEDLLIPCSDRVGPPGSSGLMMNFSGRTGLMTPKYSLECSRRRSPPAARPHAGAWLPPSVSLEQRRRDTSVSETCQSPPSKRNALKLGRSLPGRKGCLLRTPEATTPHPDFHSPQSWALPALARPSILVSASSGGACPHTSPSLLPPPSSSE